jgi:hypothetical protein
MSDQEMQLSATTHNQTPILIDLTWAKNDLVGLTCPFCGVLLDWETFKQSMDTDIKPVACNHLNFASINCLQFDLAGNQLSKQLIDLGKMCGEPIDTYVSGYESQIDEMWFVENIVSDLQGCHYYNDTESIYGRYLGDIQQKLTSFSKELYENYEHEVEENSTNQIEVEYEIEQLRTELVENILPNVSLSQGRYENDQFKLKENELLESIRAQSEVYLDYRLWDDFNPTGFFDWIALQRLENLIIIFTATQVLSDKCWCAIYSSKP